VRRFEIADEGAVAAFNVKLLDDSNGRVVASRIVRATAPVAGAANPAAVAALDAAMDEAFVEITRWVLGQI
jgi:cholesterol transport system auxiliary component